MTKILEHARRQAIAYVALFVALGGTSYALSLPNGSVGGPQIQNHAITPAKFDPKFINGGVRAWASVSANGRVTAGRPKPKVGVGRIVPGLYVVTWRSVSLVRCAPIADVDDTSAPGFALAALNGPGARQGSIVVNTYDSHGQEASLPFHVAVVC